MENTPIRCSFKCSNIEYRRWSGGISGVCLGSIIKYNKKEISERYEMNNPKRLIRQL